MANFKQALLVFYVPFRSRVTVGLEALGRLVLTARQRGEAL